MSVVDMTKFSWNSEECFKNTSLPLIFAVIGKTCSGKDTIVSRFEESGLFQSYVNFIMPYTTRPERGDEDSFAYHFVKDSYFTKNDKEFLWKAEFNNWYYGVPLSSIKTGKANLMIANPVALKQLDELLANKKIRLCVIYIMAQAKVRYDRAERRPNPDYKEISRRMVADEKDFRGIEDFLGSNEHSFLESNPQYRLNYDTLIFDTTQNIAKETTNQKIGTMVALWQSFAKMGNSELPI